MKHCNACGQDKAASEFHKRAASPDGLAARCKECQREYDRKRANDPARKAARAAYAKTPQGIERGTAAKKKYRDKNVKKRRAHAMIDRRMMRGKLIKQPCEVCGELHVIAHHDDYDFPLVIRWLCPAHHAEWHKENGPGKNG